MTEIVEGTFDPADFSDELATAASNLDVGTRLRFENDRIKVWEITLAPGERCPFHAHTRRYFWTVTAGASAGNVHPTAPSGSDGTRSATPSTWSSPPRTR